MRKLNILKTLIDLFFFFSALAVVGLAIFTVMAMFSSPEESLPIKMKGYDIVVGDWPTKMLLAFALFSALFFVYAIFLLRKVIGHFMKREVFDANVIVYFQRIGTCLIAAALLTDIPLFIYNALHRNNPKFEFTAGGFDSFLLAVSLGLFFMVLSEVFKIARNLKEENELTV